MTLKIVILVDLMIAMLAPIGLRNTLFFVLPLLLFFAMFISFYSLHYHRLLYKIDDKRFAKYFNQLRFPLNIFRWDAFGRYAESTKREATLSGMQLNRMTFAAIYALLGFITPTIGMLRNYADNLPFPIGIIIGYMMLFVVEITILYFAWNRGKSIRKITRY